MKPAEIVTLIEYLRDRAPHTRIEAGTAQAWADDLSGWSFEDGKEAVRRATAERSFVGIAEIVLALKAIRQERVNSTRAATAQDEAHCGRAGCRCTHTDGCYAGWLDSREHPGAVAPCRICRYDLARALDQAPPLGKREHGANAVIADRNKTKENAA